MKKTFTLLTLFLSITLFAQYAAIEAGNLNIFSESGEPFFMYLNGELQNESPKTNIRIENLNQRYYNVKIIFENKNLKSILKNYVSVTSNDGLTFEEATYKIKIDEKSKKTKLNYFSGTPIIPDFIPPSNVFVINKPEPANQNVNINTGINININNNNLPVTGQNSKKSRDYNYQAMNSNEFETVLNAIKKESFDDNKLAIAKNILLNNYLSTKQISQIAPYFSFSQNQMIFVKNAYNRCTDIKNYYLIKDIFKFDSDKKEFMNFINNQ